MPNFGYAGAILKVDLSSRQVTKEPSQPYTDRFIGGHGVAAKLFWDMAPPGRSPGFPALRGVGGR